MPLMTYDEQIWLLKQISYWYRDAIKAIRDAGGVPEFILDKFPPDLLNVLVRNDIHLIYTPKKEVD